MFETLLVVGGVVAFLIPVLAILGTIGFLRSLALTKRLAEAEAKLAAFEAQKPDLAAKPVPAPKITDVEVAILPPGAASAPMAQAPIPAPAVRSLPQGEFAPQDPRPNRPLIPTSALWSKAGQVEIWCAPALGLVLAAAAGLLQGGSQSSLALWLSFFGLLALAAGLGALGGLLWCEGSVAGQMGAEREKIGAGLVAAGLGALVVALFVGQASLGVFNPFAATWILGLIAACAILLALHGNDVARPFFALGAIVIGFAAPLALGADRGAPLWVFAYFAALGGAAIWVARWRLWTPLALAGLGGLAGWGAYFAWAPLGADSAFGHCVLAMLLAAYGIAFAWRIEGEAPAAPKSPSAGRLWLPQLHWSAAGLAAHLAFLAAGLLLAARSAHGDASMGVALALTAMSAMAVGAGALRAGFTPLAPLLCGLAAAAFALWPDSAFGGPLLRSVSAAGIGLIAGLGGFFVCWRRRGEGLSAFASALTPIAVLVAASFDPVAGLIALILGALALVLALLSLLALEFVVRRVGAPEAAPGAVAAYALGAAASAGAAPILAFDGALAAAGFAFLAPAAAWLDMRYGLRILRHPGLAAGILAALALGLWSLNAPLNAGPSGGQTPAISWIGPVAASGLACLCAGWIWSGLGRVLMWCAALAEAGLLALLAVRAGAGAERLSAPIGSAGEGALLLIAIGACAYGLWRIAAPKPAPAAPLAPGEPEQNAKA